MSVTDPFLPLSRPHITKEIFDNIAAVLNSGKLSGDGPFCHKVEKKLQDLCSVKHALLTSSCTHALEMSMMLLNANPGDEVILPSFTFSSTANAIMLAGLKPVFCEIDPATMNMDMNDVERRITSKTKCIMPVHYAGVSCDMDKLFQICKGKNITIVEDAAQGIGAQWKDKYLGTLGHMGCLSFHDTKNVMCGEGGAFLTNDPELETRAQIIREKGTNRSQFIKGQVDKYTWIETGSSYILAEPLAAILDVQLDLMNEMHKKRGVVYDFYCSQLKPLESNGTLTLPKIPQNCKTNYHLFHILLRNEDERNALMDFLRTRQIGATFHYLPLHLAPAGQKLGYKKGDLPITEEYAPRLLRLPLYPNLTQDEMARVVEEVFDWASSLSTPF